MMDLRRYHAKLFAVLTGLAMLTSYSVGAAAQSQGGPLESATAQAMPRMDYVGRMTVEPAQAPPGKVITATGTGLPANVEMALVWQTVKGSWVLRGAAKEEYHGRRYDPVLREMKRVRTDASGRVQTTFVVPNDFGFMHNVMLMQDGVIRNQAGFMVEPEASAFPRSGPVGTPIQVTLRGVGWQNLENSWMLMYDNKFTGWLSAVTTGGTARAVIPATGRPGKHLIQIVHGAFTVPYLNGQQSPSPDRPSFSFPFEITEGKAVLPPAPSAQSLAVLPGKMPVGTSPAIWTDISFGHVGRPMKLMGRGLPANQPAEVLWGTVVGNRVAGDGWAGESRVIAKAATDASGSFTLNLPVPDDLGGAHPIAVKIGTRTLAETTFTISPSAIGVTPGQGPVGTPITVHLKGIGWTETANIYHIVYDNAYLGYACGFNSQGDVQVKLRATGEPGWHFIDLYAGIYKGREVAGIQNFRIPQLTAAADHPGERLPTFRFAFFVTK
jgi:hypothetical protein